jgi:hypothetical protein
VAKQSQFALFPKSGMGEKVLASTKGAALSYAVTYYIKL